MQLHPVLILADQLAYVLAAGAITTPADLLIHKGPQGVGQEMFIVLMLAG